VKKEEKVASLIDSVFGYANHQESTAENYADQIAVASEVALVIVKEVVRSHEEGDYDWSEWQEIKEMLKKNVNQENTNF